MLEDGENSHLFAGIAMNYLVPVVSEGDGGAADT